MERSTDLPMRADRPRSYGRHHRRIPSGGAMSDHPNVQTIEAMTTAVFEQDHDTLAKVFTDDLVFHLRGPHPMAGDLAGLGGFLDALGWIFEATGGSIDLDQKLCV